MKPEHFTSVEALSYARRAAKAGQRVLEYIHAAHNADGPLRVGFTVWERNARVWESLARQEATTAFHYANISLELRNK